MHTRDPHDDAPDSEPPATVKCVYVFDPVVSRWITRFVYDVEIIEAPPSTERAGSG